MLKRDEQRLLVKIATLYYEQGKKQSDIAKLLDLSQSFVSRALSRCLKENLVKISVVQPANIYLNLEAQLQQQFELSQAIVVDVDDPNNKEQIKKSIGSAAAHYLETSLHHDDLVGISSWSSTIRAMVEQLHPTNVTARGVVQLLGGVGINGNIQATMLTYSLANLLNCHSYLLPSQSIERTVEYKNRLLTTEDVGSVVGMFKEVDLALVGIGMLEPSSLLKTSGNYYQGDMLDLLSKKGAVGDICLHYYDEKGQPVLSDEDDPVIGMDLALLKSCPRVVALVGGKDKTQAIKGALQGHYIDVLIVDYATAELLLR
ncbi:sugar-binding transcriptional regulator [Celerinatantimonas yamalensis]|uniref:Sugar-binding transcriptional regulator n=1 Tax=Celerinatantimonas yamalensis TaxID=559956 RepID=A0ABW9G5L8_9GAMM